jgi:hypothetical protein
VGDIDNLGDEFLFPQLIPLSFFLGILFALLQTIPESTALPALRPGPDRGQAVTPGQFLNRSKTLLLFHSASFSLLTNVAQSDVFQYLSIPEIQEPGAESRINDATAKAGMFSFLLLDSNF